jgi:hypothetical protein
MSEYTELYLIATLAVVLVGYLANVGAFLPTDRFPILRLIDGKPVATSEEQNFC